jgi:MerR family copper efflux transcriptional regulator
MKSSPPPARAETWTVGEAAAKFDLPTHALRHWEDVGLLSPDRDGGGRRRYRSDDIVRIAIIVRNKAAGMTLDQIRVLLDEGAPNRHQVLLDHVADLDRRMAEMQRSREMTMHAFECERHDVTRCPRFTAMVADLVA